VEYEQLQRKKWLQFVMFGLLLLMAYLGVMFAIFNFFICNNCMFAYNSNILTAGPIETNALVVTAVVQTATAKAALQSGPMP